MALFQWVDVAELNVLDAYHTSVLHQLHSRLVFNALVVEDQVPRQRSLLTTILRIAKSDESIELDTDRYIPPESWSVVLKPHLLVPVHKVWVHIVIKLLLDFAQNEGKVIQARHHEVDWPYPLRRADFLVMDVDFDWDLTIPQLSSEFMVHCVTLYPVFAFTK